MWDAGTVVKVGSACVGDRRRPNVRHKLQGRGPVGKPSPATAPLGLGPSKPTAAPCQLDALVRLAPRRSGPETVGGGRGRPGEARAGGRGMPAWRSPVSGRRPGRTFSGQARWRARERRNAESGVAKATAPAVD